MVQSLGFAEVFLFLLILAVFCVPAYVVSIYLAKKKGLSIGLAVLLTFCLSWLGTAIVAMMAEQRPAGNNESGES
ncbi:MAG: hypothetical protein CMN76_06465 [Spirochaetaceae bacterium]|nr:hypothetical protein [Spirochaetaceae bacterium]|tara:strand:+ start:346320 stop:346544 length:225 start_codon:yes stop_codon:yes gene_type:complete